VRAGAAGVRKGAQEPGVARAGAWSAGVRGAGGGELRCAVPEKIASRRQPSWT
jgi:hypothetical protein